MKFAPLPRIRSAPRRGAGPALYHVVSGDPLPDGPFVALIPGADAPLLPVDLPARLKGEARSRVARRQITDQIGAGAGALTLRPMATPGHTAAWRSVMVTSEAARRDWRTTLAADLTAAPGATCRAILPDYLALPAAEGLWTLDAAPGEIRARLGLGDGFTAEAALALALLRRALATGPKPRAVLCPTPPPPAIAAFLADENLKVATDIAALAALGLAAPLVLGHGEAALDLAQDAEADLARMRRVVRPWIWAVVLGVAGLGLWTTARGIETNALRAEALSERLSAEAIARDELIPAGPILDLRLQIGQRIAALQAAAAQEVAEAPPLAVLRRAADVLVASGAEVRRAAYRPGSGLLVDLEVSDFAALDRLAASLRGDGVPTIIAQSISRDKGTVAATLQLGNRSGGTP